MSDQHSLAGAAISTECRASIETEPANPKHACAKHYKRGIVRRARIFRKSGSFAEEKHEDQSADPGCCVDNQTTGEINYAAVGQPATAPDPMGYWCVDNQKPQSTKDQNRREIHAFGECPDNQRWCYDRKGHLEHDEDAFRNCT